MGEQGARKGAWQSDYSFLNHAGKKGYRRKGGEKGPGRGRSQCQTTVKLPGTGEIDLSMT
jgi:hypothetical protein